MHVQCNLKKTESYPSTQSKGTVWAFITWQAITPGSTLRTQSKCHVGTRMKIQLLDAWLQCKCDSQTLAVFESSPNTLATLQVKLVSLRTCEISRVFLSQTCSGSHGVQVWEGGGFPSASQLRVRLCCTPTIYSAWKLTILGGSVHQIGKQKIRLKNSLCTKAHLHDLASRGPTLPVQLYTRGYSLSSLIVF